MSEHIEKVIDPNLDAFLKTNLESGDVEGIAEDFNVEEDPVGVSPCNVNTRIKIYDLLKVHNIMPNEPGAAIKLIQSIKSLTEEEGKAYIEALESQKAHLFSKELSVKLMTGVNSFLLDYGCDDISNQILNDQSFMSEVDYLLGLLFGKMGHFKLPFIYLLYAGSSLYHIRKRTSYRTNNT